jgi:hypothetical protein
MLAPDSEQVVMRASTFADETMLSRAKSAIWSISAEGGGCHVAADRDIA